MSRPVGLTLYETIARVNLVFLYTVRRQNVKVRLQRANVRAQVNYYSIVTDTRQATTLTVLSYSFLVFLHLDLYPMSQGKGACPYM